MSSPSTNTPKPYTAPTFEIWAWGLGAIAMHALIQVYGQAINLLTVGYALSPLLVSLCGMLPRVVDGIMDPILGHLSDNTHTRWGRRKPFLVIGAITGTLFMCAVWWANAKWSVTVQFTYLLALGCLFYVAWGVFSMAWTAMGYELTDDYNERSRVAAISGIFLALVTFTVQWMYWLALRPLFHTGVIETFQHLWSAIPDWSQVGLLLRHAFADEKGAPHDEINGMRWISSLMAILILGSAFVATVFCKERFTHVNKKAHVPILPALKATLRSRSFVILLIFRSFQLLVERAPAMGLFFYIAVCWVCDGDKASASKFLGIAATGATILSFPTLWVLKPITKWIGKRNAQIASAGLILAIALTLPLFLNKSHPSLLVYPWLLFVLLGTINAALISAMIPDICDIDELENDTRREGLFTAVLGFVTKFWISLSILLLGGFLQWAGFDGTIAHQSPAFLNKLFWFCIVPNIVFSIAHLIFCIAFPITSKQMEEVRRKLDERRLERAERGIPTDEAAEEYVHEHPELMKEQEPQAEAK
jgi:GPH family glycoside/pentoside/hexuronide:cation symporter